MTNIGMIGRRNKAGEMEFITAIADSQGTIMARGDKGDGLVKMCAVGDERKILLLGTGDYDAFNGTVEELRNTNGIGTVEEAAQAVLDLTHQRYMRETKDKPESLTRRGFELDFFVCGPGRNELTMTKVNTTGFMGNRKRDRYGNRASFPVTVERGTWGGTFDGSALRHINRYAAGQQDSGRPIIIETIADALVSMHDLSLRGARDIGVDDKLSYGIIVPGRTVRLIHPNARFEKIGDYLEHVAHSVNLDVASVLGGLDEEGDPAMNSAARDLSSDIGRLDASFYLALASELGESSALKREHTRLSEMLVRNPGYTCQFEEVGKRRVQSLAHIQKGVEILLSCDAMAMRDYVKDSHGREMAVLNRLIEKYGPAQ